jgi:alpha-D-ribose 1-methylphosphonate 5-triphosphate synthase subunit PhnI
LRDRSRSYVSCAYDKRLKSLFGSSEKSTLMALTQMLQERGFGRRRPHVAEKVMRVVRRHLLSHELNWRPALA